MFKINNQKVKAKLLSIGLASILVVMVAIINCPSNAKSVQPQNSASDVKSLPILDNLTNLQKYASVVNDEKYVFVANAEAIFALIKQKMEALNKNEQAKLKKDYINIAQKLTELEKADAVRLAAVEKQVKLQNIVARELIKFNKRIEK